jgi:hypothetical protein
VGSSEDDAVRRLAGRSSGAPADELAAIDEHAVDTGIDLWAQAGAGALQAVSTPAAATAVRRRPVPAGWAGARGSPGRKPMAGRYEYKVEEVREGMLGSKMSGDKLEKVLNDNARDGWQLKAITAVEVKGRVGPGGVEGVLVTFERSLG